MEVAEDGGHLSEMEMWILSEQLHQSNFDSSVLR